MFTPQLATLVTLDPGMATEIVQGATGTGATKSNTFSVQMNSDVTFQLIPTSISAFVVNIEVSSDGGTTWATHPNGSALDFGAAPVKLVLNLGPGVEYRINVTSITGTSANMVATAADAT